MKLIPLLLITSLFLSCNRIGYGLNQETGAKVRRLIDTYGGSWVKNLETGKVVVFNPEGKLIGYYNEKLSK